MKCNKDDCEFRAHWTESGCRVFDNLNSCTLYKLENGIKIELYKPYDTKIEVKKESKQIDLFTPIMGDFDENGDMKY